MSCYLRVKLELWRNLLTDYGFTFKKKEYGFEQMKFKEMGDWSLLRRQGSEANYSASRINKINAVVI